MAVVVLEQHEQMLLVVGPPSNQIGRHHTEAQEL
jgi:hypothetical protein